MRNSNGTMHIVTRLRIVRHMQPIAPKTRHAERLHRAAEVGAALCEAGCVLLELLDAQPLQTASAEPARALFIAR